MRRSLSLMLACTVALSLAGGAHASKELSDKGVLLDKVVAIVNDGVVLESELDEQIKEIENRLRDQRVVLPSEDVLRSQVLDRLIVEEIQAQHADRAGIDLAASDLH